jgi:hypothetical protein
MPAHGSPSPRRRLPRILLGIAVVLLLAVGLVATSYHRQLQALLTHWKGSPTHTTAYTPPPEDPPALRVAVAGDIGDSGPRLSRTAEAMASVAGDQGFQVLLLLGDNVYPNGEPGRLGKTVFRPFAPLLRSGTKLLAIVGNHDVRDGNGEPQMRALGMPGLWWSTEIGDALFIGLDSNDPDNPRQRRWLIRTLESSTATWKIVALHHPPYSAGYQGSNRAVRRAFAPIFERYGVQLVLSGHDHDYQRSEPMNGVTYLVSGGAAGARRTGGRDFTAASFSWHHFVELDIWPGRMVGRAVNQEERVADTWTLRPSPDRSL